MQPTTDCTIEPCTNSGDFLTKLMKRNALPADLLKRYITQECTEEERRIVDEWYSQLDHEHHKAPYCSMSKTCSSGFTHRSVR
jgi:hypothetical protein